MDLDWRRIWSTVVGSTIFKILSLFFVLFCGYVGFSPEDWVRTLIPTTLAEGSLLTARVVFLFLGSAAVVLWIQQLRAMHWPSAYVPMSWAVVRAYEEAQLANLRFAELAEVINAGDEAIINIFGKHLGRRIETFGTRPPSTLREVFLISSNGTFKNRGDEYWDRHSTGPTYTNVQVKRADLNTVLAAFRRGEDPIE